MRCSRTHHLYEEYVVGHLPSRTAARIDDHLAACGPCRDFYESNDEISEILIRGSQVAHPGEAYIDDLSSRVLNVLESDPDLGRPPVGSFRRHAASRIITPGRPLWWAGGLAATVLLILGGWSALAPQSEVEWASARQDFPPTRRVDFAADGSERRAGSVVPRIQPVAAPVGPTLAQRGDPPALIVGRNANASPRLGAGVQRSLWMIVQVPAVAGVGARRALAVSISPNARRSSPTAQPDPSQFKAMATTISMLTRPIFLPEPTRGGRSPAPSPVALRRGAAGFGPNNRAEVSQQVSKVVRKLSQDVLRSAPLSDAQREEMLERQKDLLRRGEEKQNEGRHYGALKSYYRAVMLDSTTNLAREAFKRIADISFEQGYFEQAHRFYKRCAKDRGGYKWDKTESAHVNRRHELLSRFAKSGWAPLAQAHMIAQGPWSRAPGALKNIAGNPDAKPLLCDSARALVRRITAGDRPSDRVMLEIIGLLENSVAHQETPAARADLYLCIGNMNWLQFKDLDASIAAYESAIRMAPTSPQVQTARERIRLVREQTLHSSIR